MCRSVDYPADGPGMRGRRAHAGADGHDRTDRHVCADGNTTADRHAGTHCDRTAHGDPTTAGGSGDPSPSGGA